MGPINKSCKKKIVTKKLLVKRRKLEKKIKHVNRALAKYDILLTDTTHNFGNEDVSKKCFEQNMLCFKKVREEYFKLLYNKISQNLRRSSCICKEVDVENLALEMEQRALIACMQSSVYKKAIYKIITEVHEASCKKELHPMISLTLDSLLDQPANEPTNKHVLNACNQISQAPKTSSIPCNQSTKELEAGPNFSWVSAITSTVPIRPDEGNNTMQYKTKPVSRVQPQTKVSPVNEKVLSGPLGGVEAGLTDFIFQCKIDNLVEPEKVAPDCSIDNVHQEELDIHIESLMHILEGSDNEDQHDNSKMRKVQELFGYDEAHASSVETLPHASHPRHPSPNSTIKIWKNERFIFMYKVFKKCKFMSSQKFFHTRKMFNTLFGDDSDYEHEESFEDSEAFLASCARRILPTVVKYVMPYYKQRRICGGSYIFKNLVRRIADSLIDLKDYPSESDVEHYVRKFFPGNKKYMNVTDVWCFVLDNEMS